MCGSSPSQKFPGVGTVWFLARPGIEAHSLSLTKQAGPYLDMLTLPYPLGLAAVMWGGNRMHERWAKLVGFATKGVEIRNGEEFLIIHRPSRNAQCAPPSMSPELPS